MCTEKMCRIFINFFSTLNNMFSVYISFFIRRPQNQFNWEIPTYLIAEGKRGHSHLVFEEIKCNIFS